MKRLHYTIDVYTESLRPEFSHRLKWDNFSLDQFGKWRWYFEYRAALEKIKNPRYKIQCTWGAYEVDTRSHQDKILEDLKKRINARKAHLQKWINKEKELRDNWREIFPFEDHPVYLHIQDKILSNKCKLNELQREFKTV